MTSKISYSKLIRQSVRQRAWYCACMALVLFIFLPITAMLRFSGDVTALSAAQVTDTVTALENMKANYRAFLAGGYSLTALAVGAGALLAAWSGLSYLHSSRKLDMLYSLPVKKETIFFAETWASLLLFAVPYAVNLLLANIVGAVRGIYEPDMAGVSLTAFAVHLVFFLAIYFFGAVAMILTGKLLAGILGSLTLLGFLPGLALLLQQLPFLFFTTYCQMPPAASAAADIAKYLSPAYGLGACCARAGRIGIGDGGEYWNRILAVQCREPILLAAAAGIAMGVLSWRLVKIRPSEGAGRALVFGRTESAFKLALLPVLGLFGGLFFRGLVRENDSQQDAWFWFGIVFALILFSVVIELIYHFDRKRLLDHKLCTGLAALVTVGIGAWFQMDLGGFDTFLPDTSRVESMAVSCSSWGGLVMTENGETPAQAYLEEYGMMESFDPIYKLAQTGVETVRTGVPEDADTEYVTVIYRMQNGQTKHRQYCLPVTALQEAEEQLYEQEPYRNVIFPILTQDLENVRISEVYDPSVTVDLSQMSREECVKLTEAYQEELASMSYQQLQEPVLAILRFEDLDGLWIGEGAPINRFFVNTLEVLKERGYEPDASLNNIRITGITVECYRENTAEMEAVDDAAVFSADTPEEIEAVRKDLVWDEYGWLLAFRGQFEPDIYAYVEGINEQGESVNVSCRYPIGKIPELVKEFYGLSE